VGPQNHRVLGEVHIHATWKMHSNNLCMAAMLPFVKLFCTLCQLVMFMVDHIKLLFDVPLDVANIVHARLHSPQLAGKKSTRLIFP